MIDYSNLVDNLVKEKEQNKNIIIHNLQSNVNQDLNLDLDREEILGLIWDWLCTQKAYQLLNEDVLEQVQKKKMRRHTKGDNNE